MDRTRNLIGTAPDRAEVLDALPAESTALAVERCLLEWEERQGHVAAVMADQPAWIIFADEPLLFLPTDSGAETLAITRPIEE